MLVVEMSSTGAEILLRIVPKRKDCFVVKLRSGNGPDISALLGVLLVVKARLSDILANLAGRDFFSERQAVCIFFDLRPASVAGKLTMLVWGRYYPNLVGGRIIRQSDQKTLAGDQQNSKVCRLSPVFWGRTETSMLRWGAWSGSYTVGRAR